MSASTKRPQGGKSLNLLPDSYVVVDVETTGLSFELCDIIEIGAARVVGGEVTETFETLVRISDKLPSFIVDFTGITDEMLLGAPDEAAAIELFSEFAGDSVLMAHNANFDMTFLYLAYERHLGRPLANDFIDTLKVARRAFPDMEHRRSEDLCSVLCVTNERPHRALPDARAEHECYLVMRSMLLEKYGEEGYSKLFRSAPSKKLSAAEIVAQGVPDEDNPLYGMNVVFTGAMATMVRREAMQALRNIGGNPQDGVRKDTDYLVFGNEGFAEANKNSSGKMDKARRNQLKGLPIQVISEDAFLEMLQS